MKNEYTGLSGLAIRRPVFTSMVMLGLVVLGFFSYRRLPIDQFPSVDIPVAAVQTVYPGASPEAVEREVTRRMEEAFNTVQGVKRITSMSLEGVSQVIVEFELERKIDDAAQDIRTKIEMIKRDLPEDIDPPLVLKFDPAALPIISLGLASSTMPIPELTIMADEQIRRSLESVNGVGEVQLTGGLKREVRVYLQPDKMLAVGVSVPQVMGALQRQNMEVPAGRVERGANETLVRVLGRLQRVEDFNSIFITNKDGHPVRLGDVARVVEGTEDERSLAYINGERTVALDILKVSGANTVQVADRVNAQVAKLRASLPKGVELRTIRDNSVWIRTSVTDVVHELLIGAVLTVLVVMLFLNDWKATAITSLALPVSIVSSFILMNALHFSLNLISLLALSLSIGILIDDAIVVIENIVRHRESGQDHFYAASVGTQEIVLAVMATTFSIVAVFVPVAFMRGIIGRFFYQFGLTVAWAVLVSLFVSFTLTPMISAWWGVEPHQGIGYQPFTRLIGRFNSWFDRQAAKYRGAIRWALGNRKKTLGIAFGSLVAAFMLFPLIGGEFMPKSDSSEFSVTFETPKGSSLAYTRDKAAQLSNILRKLDGVDYTYTTIGAGATGTVNKGEIYVRLVPSKERKNSQQAMIEIARGAVSNIYGANTSVLEYGGMGGTQAPLQVQVKGPDIAELERLSDELMVKMKTIRGVVDVESSMGERRPELRIDVNRDLANEVGLDVGQIAGTVRPLMAGQTATRWEDATGEERDVVVQVDSTQRTSASNLAMLPLVTSKQPDNGPPNMVPLGQVARIETGTAPSEIDRVSLQRVANISAATTQDFSISKASAAIRDKIAEIDLPDGYSMVMAGETEQMEETMGYVMETMVLAVILIFLILASQFESITQPFAIMMALPLSLVGVLIALLLANNTLNMMSMIGVIMLMGLVTKNAILLVDNANERRRSGKERTQALIEAGAVRLRPIMMTTAAMIFGMLPIALALGEGSGFRAPMARAVIGGLITSTMLTLLVIPVVYTYMDDFGSFVRRLLKGKSASGLDLHRAVLETEGNNRKHDQYAADDVESEVVAADGATV